MTSGFQEWFRNLKRQESSSAHDIKQPITVPVFIYRYIYICIFYDMYSRYNSKYQRAQHLFIEKSSLDYHSLLPSWATFFLHQLRLLRVGQALLLFVIFTQRALHGGFWCLNPRGSRLESRRGKGRNSTKLSWERKDKTPWQKRQGNLEKSTDLLAQHSSDTEIVVFLDPTPPRNNQWYTWWFFHHLFER